ncbi:MAG: SWIM zinc finger family protein [Collinsella aerofaciens]
MDEHEVIDYDCDCPAAYRYPGMCKHAIATALAYLTPAAPSPSKVCARRFARLRRSRNSPRAPRPPRRPSTLTFPSGARPHEPELCGGAFRSFDARMDELASMRRKLAGAVDPDAPKRR